MGQRDDVVADYSMEWNGVEDSENPLNWSFARKVYHTAIPTSIAFLCPYGSSVYTPSTQQIESYFSIEREVALLPFSFYLLGLSFGPVLAGPISETFGRKAVYMSGLPLFALFTLGAGFSQSIDALIICRFFAGLFSSPGLSIGTGTIADVWSPDQRGVPLAAYVTCVQMAPALGPLVGGFVVERENWRWTQWTILFAAAAVTVFALGMSETYKSRILQTRATRSGSRGDSGSQRNKRQIIRDFVTKIIIRPMHMLFTELIVTLFDLYIAVNFGLLNAFFAAFPFVFERQYRFHLSAVGLTFLGQIVGSIVGFVLIVAFYKLYYDRKAQCQAENESTSKLPPEERLWIAMAGAPMLPISLAWFGWTAKPNIHWISPITAEAFFSCGNLLIFTSGSAYITDCYGALYGASAWSSNTFLRYLFSTVFPLFALQLYENLGVGWASTLLAFVTLALLPIPFAFYKYGPVLRKGSKYKPDE